MAQLIAELNDADITLMLHDLEAGEKRFWVIATRCDGVSPPETVLDERYGSLSQAIKAIAIFYVSEWESVFITNRLSEKMVDAIQAR